MKKILLLVAFNVFLSGCVTLHDTAAPEEKQPVVRRPASSSVEVTQKNISSELQNIEDEDLKDYAKNNGVIFSKTDFQGLLETRYVKFLFEDINNPEHKFHLHIGDTSEQQTFPWSGKSVKPGYFFVELPAGSYKITSVSIPVGSTTASEEMDIMLEVVPNVISYIGTLKMVGTKEKIKLGGGLPVIKPGFEYTVAVLDQHQEGITAFRERYPNFPHGISVQLMQVHKTTNASAP